MKSTGDIVKDKADKLAAPNRANDTHGLIAAVSHMAEMSGYPAVMVIEGAFSDPVDILTMDLWGNVRDSLSEAEKCLGSTSFDGIKRLYRSLANYVSSVPSKAGSDELVEAFCLIYYASQCLRAATQQALPECEISLDDRMPGARFSESPEVYSLVSRLLIASGKLDAENKKVSEELGRLAVLLAEKGSCDIS